MAHFGARVVGKSLSTLTSGHHLTGVITQLINELKGPFLKRLLKRVIPEFSYYLDFIMQHLTDKTSAN